MFSVHLNRFSVVQLSRLQCIVMVFSLLSMCLYSGHVKKKKKILTSVSGLKSAPNLNETDPIRCVLGCDDGFN